MRKKKYIKRGTIIQGYTSKEHPLYNIYNLMLARCYKPNVTGYKNYGGRGITVCEEWLECFETFCIDMGLKPDNSSLDRIDNNKGYSKENCKWSTRSEQNRNKRTYETSKTGHGGIRETSSGGYQVRVKNTREVLGVFRTLEEALEAQSESRKQDKPRLTNTTGCKGVTIHSNGSYMVRRIINQVRVYLGNTETLDEAVKLYESGIKQEKKYRR